MLTKIKSLVLFTFYFAPTCSKFHKWWLFLITPFLIWSKKGFNIFKLIPKLEMRS